MGHKESKQTNTYPNKDNHIHVVILYKLLPMKINEVSHVCYVSTGS